jgi:hypothetical protein
MDLLNCTGHSAPMVIFKTAGRLAHGMTSNYEGRVIAFIPRDGKINFTATLLHEINCPEILIDPGLRVKPYTLPTLDKRIIKMNT